MQDKPLDRTEHELLAIILELHAARGPIDRNLLSVVARGRGMEVARPLARLKNLGLVEEFERKPFFLKRIFGARPVALLRPLPPAMPAAMPVPVAEAPVVTTADAGPGADGIDTGAALMAPAQDSIPEAPQDAPPAAQAEIFAPAEPGVYVPPVYEAPIYQPPVPEAPVPEMPATERPFTEAPGQDHIAEADAPGEEIDLDSESDELDMSDFALPLDAPELPEESAAAPSTAAPAAARPARRKVPVGYTDEIGGIAQAFEIAPQMPDLSPELMDGLREVLGGVGMELTMAGEALIGDRMAKGASAGEALSQVVLFAFAHAVRYDAASEGEVKALGLNDYAVEVMRELEKLRDAGEIGEQCFEDDMRRLWRLVEDTPEGTEAAEALLQDPVGGAAPTALLPEDLRQADEA
ncbi:hypothetical protein [Phaeovulum sp. W22_SRMD_FR3]|uniref:hypothetical protein n=1 Tax=Phaeovulum sp. W22_SRMD_FR3 TaxID=3240274 RepID=UPI003F964D52